MNKHFLKIATLIIGGGLILTLSLFVLFNKQPDTLVRYVPAESELYFHSNGNALKSFNENLQNKITELFNIDAALFAKLKETEHAEVGLFYYKNNSFILTRENGKNLAKKLNVQQGNPFVARRKFLDFSDFQLYSKKIPAIFANFSNTTDEYTVTYGNIGKQKVCLTSSAPKILSRNPAFISTSGVNKTFYTNGLVLNNNLAINQTNAVTYPNLAVTFLAKILGPMEVVLLEKDDFILGFDAKTNQNAKIRQILSNYFPKKQTKTLPDGTISNNLIADPFIFNEQTLSDTTPNISALSNNTGNLLYILQQGKKTFVSNKKELLQYVQPETISNAPVFNIFHSDTHILGTQSFCGQLRVCID